MTVLGFHGVHPLALLVFPASLLLTLGGPWRAFRLRRELPAWMLRGYLGLLALLLSAFISWLPTVARSFNLALMSYVGLLGCLGALWLVLEAFAWWARRAQRKDAPVDGRRRAVLAGAALLVAAPFGAMAAGERSTPDGQVRSRAVRLDRDPRARPGRPLKISLLSDLHAGFFLPQAYLNQALRQVEAFGPDVILFGGDLIDLELTGLGQTRPFLRALCGLAPVYSVLGNHDNYRNPAEVAAFEADCGLTVLRGQRTELSGSFGAFTLCGARDFVERERPEKSLGGPQTLASTLFLAHNPATALAVAPSRAPWLSLCGHTHGGQIRLPGVGALVNQADRRIEPGANRLEGRNILVTAGVGFAGLPVRLFCPPEVAHLTIA